MKFKIDLNTNIAECPICKSRPDIVIEDTNLETFSMVILCSKCGMVSSDQLVGKMQTELIPVFKRVCDNWNDNAKKMVDIIKRSPKHKIR